MGQCCEKAHPNPNFDVLTCILRTPFFPDRASFFFFLLPVNTILSRALSMKSSNQRNKSRIKTMKKPQFLKNPVFFLFLLITASSLTIIIFSFLKLPETPLAGGNHLNKLRNDDLTDELGFFGKMMIEMLPEDLVFTAFVPSDKSFSRDLGMKSNNSRQIKSPEDEDGDNTYAVVSRIMSFAVVPYKVEEVDIGNDETASYESLSGFTLKIWRKRNGGGLVVNGIETEKMGLKRGKIIAHIMNGVVMDSDFAQSVASSTPQEEDDEP